MKNLRLMLGMIILLLTNMIFGQNEKCKFNGGLELDVLPYVFSGYYGSVWVKYDNIRIRPVITKINQPKFVYDKNFENLNTNVYALLIDYVFTKDEGLKDLWIGSGFEYWHNEITEKNSKLTKEFNNVYFTLGSGYFIYLTDNLYLNPWCAVHAKIAGNKEISFVNNNFKSGMVVPEASLKIGYKIW